MNIAPPLIKKLGLQDYLPSWQAMQEFTKARDENTQDEIWILEHPRVFTLGRNGKQKHLLKETNIPVIKVDRGGQITYHGPGQLIVYLLIDLKRRKLGVRQLVTLIEESIIELLARYHVSAVSDKNAPGVYVDNRKIAALGIRVSKGCTTHGLSLNIDMDLSPFQNINPCGYQGLEVTQCKDLGIQQNLEILGDQLVQVFTTKLVIAQCV